MKYSRNFSALVIVFVIAMTAAVISRQISYMQSVPDSSVQPEQSAPSSSASSSSSYTPTATGRCDEANPVGTCPPVINSTPTCVDGICIQNCLPGFREKDGNQSNGCETQAPVSSAPAGSSGQGQGSLPPQPWGAPTGNQGAWPQNGNQQGPWNNQGGMMPMPPGNMQGQQIQQSPFPWINNDSNAGGQGMSPQNGNQGPWNNQGMSPQNGNQGPWNNQNGGMMPPPSGNGQGQPSQPGSGPDQGGQGPMPNFCLMKPEKVMKLMDTEIPQEHWEEFSTIVDEQYTKLEDRVFTIQDRLDAEQEKKKPSASRMKTLKKQLAKAEKNLVKCEAVISAVQEKAGTTDTSEQTDESIDASE